MAQIGTKKTVIDGSIEEIPIFEPDDCAYPVRRIAVGGEVGCLPVFPIDEGDLEFDERRLYHPTYGVMAYHDQPVLMTLLDSFEYGTSTLHSRYSIPSTTSQVGTESYAGALDGDRVAFVARNTGTGGMWTVPSDGTLDQYPAPGRRFAWHFWLNDWSGGAQTWCTFGGTTDFSGGTTNNTLYEVNVIESGSTDAFRLRVRRVNSSGSVQELYTAASAFESTGGNPSISPGNWYCVLVDWYDGGRIVGRLYDTIQPDPEIDSPITRGYFDTEDFAHNPDGSGDIPQTEGRMGMRQSGSGIYSRWDMLLMYPE